MKWLGANQKPKHAVRGMALLAAFVMSTIHFTMAQAPQKGISVELAPTSSAVAVPDADKQDALIITVTESGKYYLGIDAATPQSLAEKLKGRTPEIYIKADARAPYESVVKVLDAAHASGIAKVTLLTAQPEAKQAGTLASPEGIEMELSHRPPAATK
jgi:biopolymer transport protein ExbD